MPPIMPPKDKIDLMDLISNGLVSKSEIGKLWDDNYDTGSTLGYTKRDQEIIDKYLQTTFNGLSGEQILKACKAMYSEEFI